MTDTETAATKASDTATPTADGAASSTTTPTTRQPAPPAKASSFAEMARRKAAGE